jgi:endoglucanase
MCEDARVFARRRLPIGIAGLLALSAAAVAVLAGPAAASASDPAGFQIHVPSGGLAVSENAGQAVITVTRGAVESGVGAQVRYITSPDGYDPFTNGPFDCGGTPCTAVAGTDFTQVKGELDFNPGQSSMSFAVPIADHGTDTVPKTIQVSLFGPSPIGLGRVSTTTLTILDDDPSAPPVAGNPLGLPAAPTVGNPLAGARFFVDPQSEAAQAAQSSPALNVIASQPGTARFGSFSLGSPYVPDIGTAVSRYLARAAAEAPGTVPLLATYRIVYGHCGHWSDPPSEQQAYHDFASGLAQGIGSYPAVLFLEQDALITAPCLSSRGLAVRMAELNDAINVLASTCPHLVIYLDAGAADALPARRAARLLNRAGVAKIQGFFLNATHFDWTSQEIRYGEQISRMTGGKHFVVNTGENGRGPLVPKDIDHRGNEILCNPRGRGLGLRPTASTGYPNVDMFAWTSNPGESGGRCGAGAPATGAFWPAYALMLVRNASFGVRWSRASRRHGGRSSPSR